MNIEKLVVAHFSPTGGTRRIADAIADGFGIPVSEIDLTKADVSGQLGDNDALMAVLPVFAGRVPQIALSRLAGIKAAGCKAIAVVVYGNREYDDALLETRDALEANGLHVIAAAAFIAEHSIARSIAAGRPDQDDIEIARRFGADIMQIADDSIPVQIPGKLPYKELKPSAVHPSADENCIKCNICASQCPTGAIPADDPRMPLNDLCINCMRCVQVCPKQCRALPPQFVEFITGMLNEKAAAYKKPALFL